MPLQIGNMKSQEGLSFYFQYIIKANSWRFTRFTNNIFQCKLQHQCAGQNTWRSNCILNLKLPNILFHIYFIYMTCSIVQFSHSVVFDCLRPMNRSTPGLPVHHQLLEFSQTHIHRVSDAIQPSHPLSSPSPPAPNPSQHQSLFQ